MPYKSLEKRREHARMWAQRPEVKEYQREYQQEYRKLTKEKNRKLAQKENHSRRGTVQTIPCPHCGQAVPLSDNSTFVLKKGQVGGVFQPANYRSNPSREYKQPEEARRRQLAYYWRNREKVLARMRNRRREVKALLAGQTASGS